MKYTYHKSNREGEADVFYNGHSLPNLPYHVAEELCTAANEYWSLKQENLRLKEAITPKSEMSEQIDPEGYATAAAKILHALNLVIGQDVNEWAMPVIVQIIKNNVQFKRQ